MATEVIEEQAEAAATEAEPQVRELKMEYDPTIKVSEKAKAIAEEMSKLICRMKHTEAECRQHADRAEYLKEELKEAKAALSMAEKRLVRLVGQIEYVQGGGKLDSAPPPTVTPTTPTAAGDDSQADDSEQAGEDREYNSWRDVPTTVLLDPPIEKFGPKKQESLLEALPTLGDFEDLRARVGQDAATLRELLPKGIGEAAADALEERLLSAIQKYQLADESEEAGEDETPVDADYKRQIDALVDSFVDDWFDNRPESKDQELWKRGYDAYKNGDDPEHCTWETGSDQQREWCIGWVAAYVEAEEAEKKRAEGDQPGDQPAEEPAAEEPATDADQPGEASEQPSKPVSLDDL